MNIKINITNLKDIKNIMSNYSTMSVKDLEELKERLLSQRCNLDNEIEQAITELKIKRVNLEDNTIRQNPYYKDKANVIKITINNNSSIKYTITKIKPTGTVLGIEQFNSMDVNFLKYYKMCSKLDWDNAIDRLNVWLKDANLKIKGYE